MPRDKEQDYHLNARISIEHRNGLASLGRILGLNVSEMLRWLLDRALLEDADATIAAVKAQSITKFGEEIAELQFDLELKRLRYLQSGEAVETPDGKDIRFVALSLQKKMEKATTAEPERAAV